MKDTVAGYDPLDLSAGNEAREEAGIRARQDRKDEESDIRWIMSNQKGRRIVWRFLEQAGVFRSSFDTLAMRMAFNEGNRNFGCRILSQVHAHCPELYCAMLKEHTDGRAKRRGKQ